MGIKNSHFSGLTKTVSLNSILMKYSYLAPDDTSGISLKKYYNTVTYFNIDEYFFSSG